MRSLLILHLQVCIFRPLFTPLPVLIPKDFDPEAPEGYDDVQKSSEAGGETDTASEVHDEALAREHYFSVGKSKLRRRALVLLDPKYHGARVRRQNLYGDDCSQSEDEVNKEVENERSSNDEDDTTDSVSLIEIDSEDALGSNKERFGTYKFSDSSTTIGLVKPERGINVTESSGEDSEGSTSEQDGESDGSDGRNMSEKTKGEQENEKGWDEREQQLQLQKIITEERTKAAVSMSQAARLDVAKGRAVQLQQKTFDSFLSARIKLQKGLIAVNCSPSANVLSTSVTNSQTSVTAESWKAAESAVLKLWNTITDVRAGLSCAHTGGEKRKRDAADKNTSTESMWSMMAGLEADSQSWREVMLEKWSHKTQSVATVSLANKLNNTARRSLTASIRETLTTDLERLLARTRIPRACAPVKAEQNSEADKEIYDDTDFYQQLLKALVDQRQADSLSGGAIKWSAAMRDTKKRKIIDKKASKGRKLRYHVHDKLQNFMAPIPNRSWQEQQIEYANALLISYHGALTFLVNYFQVYWDKGLWWMKMKMRR